jgi:hypothetical protein
MVSIEHLDKTDFLLGMACQTEEDKKIWHIHTTYMNDQQLYKYISLNSANDTMILWNGQVICRR